LNLRTVGMDEAAIDAARASGPPEDGAFEAMVRFAVAAFLPLARVAKERAQPMILDW
jgi:hypothetical protein